MNHRSAPFVHPLTTFQDAFAPVRLADLPDRPLSWLWPGWIPNGSLSVLAGHAGEGKSTVIAALVAALTSGAPLPDGATMPPGGVILLTAEDDPARVLRPRLIANGADPNRVFIQDRIADITALRHLIDAHDIRLLVLDPLSALSRRLDRGGESELRAAIGPLTALIAERSIACLGVMRLGKSGYGRRPTQRIVGASAIPALARSVLMVAREEQSGPGHAVLQVVKGNYAAPPPPVALRLAAGGAVEWLGPAASGIDALSETAADRRLTLSERADAADFLAEFLADGPVSADACLKRARTLGFSEITIRRAKKDLAITSFRDNEHAGQWTWRLPAPGKEGDSDSAGG